MLILTPIVYTDKISKVLSFAGSYHGNQMYGPFPYTHHLKCVLGVAQTLALPNYIEIACILHDVIEDTACNYNDIVNEFGVMVADIVYDVTDELGKTRTNRHYKTYSKIAGNEKAIAVKLCDRIANMFECTHNKKKRDMYLDEYNDFKEALYKTKYNENDDIIQDMWIILDSTCVTLEEINDGTD
jgi:(p)ppGpp synthase/HD superfamily hydrolase